MTDEFKPRRLSEIDKAQVLLALADSPLRDLLRAHFLCEDIERSAEEFKPGLYRHTNTGGLYTAICLVANGDTREPCVLYVSHTYGGLSVRPLSEKAHDGWRTYVNAVQRRFEFVGELPSDTPIAERGRLPGLEID